MGNKKPSDGSENDPHLTEAHKRMQLEHEAHKTAKAEVADFMRQILRPFGRGKS